MKRRTVLDVDPAALSFVDDDGSYAVEYTGQRVAEWPPDAACYADLEQVEDVRRSCCPEAVDVSVDCADCGARVFHGAY